MKDKIGCHKRFLGIAAALLLFMGFSIVAINGILMKKQQHYYAVNSDVTDLPYFTEKWNGFYEKEKETIDLLFLGTSVVHTDVDPNLMYHDHGFTAYVLSSDQQSGNNILPFLKEARKTQDPKAVFIDVQSMLHPVLASEISAHYSYDFMELGWNKLEGIKRISTSLAMFENILFPFTTYHDRWEELTKEDFDYFFMEKDNRLNGHFCYMLENAQAVPVSYKKSDYTLEEMGYTATRQCLDELVGYCEENNIEMVLFRTPTSYSYADSKVYDAMDLYAEEKGIRFWNFNDYLSEIGMNFATDFVDYGHMNQTGAERFSTFLGQMIREEFVLPDHRGDLQYQEWDAAYEYEQYLIHDFEMRHYATALDYADNDDYTSEDLVFLFTYADKSDLLKVSGIPKSVESVAKTKRHTNVCILYRGEVAAEISLESGTNWKSDAGAPVDVYVEALDVGTRMWFGDEFIDTAEATKMIDLILYDRKLGKVLDHVKVNASLESALKHLLNPYE